VTFIKRITQVLTPPPKSKKKSQRHAQDPNAPAASNITPLLMELLQDRPIPPNELKNNLAELKKIASHYGIAWTATDIHDSIQRLPETFNDVPLKKTRGYELAADFYRQAIRHTIQMIAQEPDSVKVADFTIMMGNFLDCEFHANKITTGIETYIRLVDTLSLKACDYTPQHAIFLQVAEKIAAKGHQWSIESRERLDRQYSRIRKRSESTEEADSEDAVSPDTGRADDVISHAMIEYLEALSVQTGRMAKSKQQQRISPSIPLEHLLSPEFEAKRESQAQYLKELADLINTTGPAVIHASVLQYLGVLHHGLGADTALTEFKTAMQIFEQQGELEAKLGLATLSKERYQRSLTIAQTIASKEDVGRIQDRLTLS